MNKNEITKQKMKLQNTILLTFPGSRSKLTNSGVGTRSSGFSDQAFGVNCNCKLIPVATNA